MAQALALMSLNLKTTVLAIAFLAFAEAGLAGVETQCGDTTVMAELSTDIPIIAVEPPFGYWMLDSHEVRVGKSTLLKILEVRETRIGRAGLHSHGSSYLRDRINSLQEAQWPVDMATLIPPSSAWLDVKRPEAISEKYLESEFYRLSMQSQEHSLLLENALYHGLGEVRSLDGRRFGYVKRYSFEERLKDDWVALGYVWVDPKGDQIYASCRIEPVSDSGT